MLMDSLPTSHFYSEYGILSTWGELFMSGNEIDKIVPAFLSSPIFFFFLFCDQREERVVKREKCSKWSLVC